MILKKTVLLFAVAMLFATQTARPDIDEHYARNWPQWRGPTGNGVAPFANPPLEWSETSNIKWKAPVSGQGHATPVIWENQVFILSAVPAPAATPASANPPPAAGGRRGPSFGGGPAPTQAFDFTIFSYDRGTGKIRWRQVCREAVPHEGKRDDNTFASGSPVTDGSHVYAFFGSRGLYCFDMEGNLKWQKDFGKMRTRNSFGEGASPALGEKAIVVVWDEEGDSWIAAFDKRNGNELWKQARDEQTGWSTPLLVDHNGATQVVVNATGAVRGYDLATGKPLWECRGQTANAIPSPVAGDGVVYVTSGFRGNALYAIKLGRTGNLSGTDAILWKYNRGTPYVPSPLLYENKIYCCQLNNPVLSCFDAKTGKPLFLQERLPSLNGVYASPVAAGGRIYLPGRQGKTAVLDNANELKVLATNSLDDKFDASPAAVDDELFLRGHDYLYCIAKP